MQSKAPQKTMLITVFSLLFFKLFYCDEIPLTIEQWNALNTVLAASKCDKGVCNEIGEDRICHQFNLNRLVCTQGYVTKLWVDDFRNKPNAFIATQIGLLTRLTFLEMFDSSMTGVRWCCFLSFTHFLFLL